MYIIFTLCTYLYLLQSCYIPVRTNEILFGSNEEEDTKEFELMSLMYKTYMNYGLDSVEYQELASRRAESLGECGCVWGMRYV